MFLSDDKPISIALFDEIEKAHPVIWSSLLGILEEGSLTLGDNRTVVLMTSNVGSRAMRKILDPIRWFSSGPARPRGRPAARRAGTAPSEDVAAAQGRRA